MGTTTMGVKLDDATRERIKMAASRIDRTPHWLIKQAIFSYLDKLENSDTLPELPALFVGAANESEEPVAPQDEPHQPFLEFAEQILPQSVSRAAITAACRRLSLSRRINWRINWRRNCAIKNPPAVARVWCKACCRSFPSLRKKA